MDTKSKNINEESIFQEEIKKSNKRKSRSGNIFKKYIVVLLTFISIACSILSLREIKANIRYIIPGGIYLNGDLSNNISDYINLVKDYSIYYKSLEYASDNNNITQNDIDICKAELVDKVNKEYENYRNDKYNEESFMAVPTITLPLAKYPCSFPSITVPPMVSAILLYWVFALDKR